MSFHRLPAANWHRDVPGARWFKADLHVHTIDDRAGGRAKMPSGLSGDPEDTEVLSRYARRFLQGAVANRVDVLGLTPHSPCVGTSPETSAVWRIVDEWNTGIDDDGTPFREKIYAIFPGFEPNVNDGGSGVHLIFLFDPEIGRDSYLRLFHAIMDGGSPWNDRGLRLTPRDANDIFAMLDKHEAESRASQDCWSFLILAPHFQGEHGLLGEVRKQVLGNFPAERIAAYELGDEKLSFDLPTTYKPGSFLVPFMEEHRQAFFHGSDAYSVSDIGRRHTWLKLASPRIEALRQAFIASDSRLRIGFLRSENGDLEPVPDPPDATRTERPWLRSVTIRGKAAFFAGGEEGVAESTFRFSPDLTCVIGGSMTGKSTLLDGLRIHTGAELPEESSLREQVTARGRDQFLAGSPEIRLECPGRDRTAPLQRQWPAVFFTQTELQQLTQKRTAVESILARLVPSEAEAIDERNGKLQHLDEGIGNLARHLAELDQEVVDAAQAEERAKRANLEITAFSEAGIEQLHQVSRSRQAWQRGAREAEELLHEVVHAYEVAGSFEPPGIEGDLAEALQSSAIDAEGLKARWTIVTQNLEMATRELAGWFADSVTVGAIAAQREDDLRVQVERTLAARGFDASRLKEFQALHQQASLLGSYEANREQAEQRLKLAQKQFDELRRLRHGLITAQREAFDRVAAQIKEDFSGRIRVHRTECGNTEALDQFLRDLKQKGITRWWHGLSDDQRPGPDDLLEALAGDTNVAASDEARTKKRLDDLQMSDAVQQTFREAMTKPRRWELAALRCPDRYEVEELLDGGTYKPLADLSGGRGVSVLLSLLLQTADDRPLVIDQPEDALDSNSLFTTVLPALKRLKGRRQIILATHNPNIVVNGDADMVIQLEASAHHGRVACSGAIEEPAVRDAIVRTVDGGREAFSLRRLKYGF